jgi:EamA domain-containing membrane protein RarD
MKSSIEVNYAPFERGVIKFLLLDGRFQIIFVCLLQEMIAWQSLLYGLVMALIDTGMLGLVKEISKNSAKSIALMTIPTMAYAIQPWVFLSGLKNETMTVMNLMWDLLSDVLVSLVGIFYFGEQIGRTKTVGLILGIISLMLMAWKED